MQQIDLNNLFLMANNLVLEKKTNEII